MHEKQITETKVITGFLFGLAVIGLPVMLQNGAKPAFLALYVAPLYSIVGAILAYRAVKRRHRYWGGLGLVFCAFWPFYTIVVISTPTGWLRVALLAVLSGLFILIGCMLLYLSVSVPRHMHEQLKGLH